MSDIRVGADIGGTFTDLVVLDGTGAVHFGKTLTTHADPSQGVLSGLLATLSDHGIALGEVGTIIHGTTLVANAIIERRGAKTALLTTEGFRDQVEIGTENRYDLYDLFLERPEPLVPRYLRLPIRERVLADGSVRTPLDEDGVRAAVRQLRQRGVEAVAVCFLHSYKNPQHERRAGAIIHAEAPELRVSLSSDVVPEIREYPRTSTTIANVYVQPIVERYLRALADNLRRQGFAGQLLIMLSGGGTCTVDTAARFPIRILESGPVGGALAASFSSARCGFDNLLVFDMGGTTAKVTLVDRGRPLRTNAFEVARAHRTKKGSGIPVKVPVIEMVEIGAGGGSIAYVDRMGLLHVGPRSAGSEPGPACYGLGGTEPTVTDADLLLGYLSPDYFLGGRMRLDVEAAGRAVAERIAGPLGMDPTAAAWGIHRIVNENMANAARIHAIERGKDIRAYPLFAFGGAGPVHACHVADILGSSRLISPVGAGVASAFGFLTAPLSFDFVRSYPGRLDRLDWAYVNRLLGEMERQGLDLLAGAGVAAEHIRIDRSCEMRYVRQTHEITVPLPPGELGPQRVDAVAAGFAEHYAELYAEASAGVPVETLNWRVLVSGPIPEIPLDLAEAAARAPEPKGHRPVYFPGHGGFQNVAVFSRTDVLPGAGIVGPAIVEEAESTMVVAPGFALAVDPYRNLIVSRHDEGAGSHAGSA